MLMQLYVQEDPDCEEEVERRREGWGHVGPDPSPATSSEGKGVPLTVHLLLCPLPILCILSFFLELPIRNTLVFFVSHAS